jgi:hypothetical protein
MRSKAAATLEHQNVTGRLFTMLQHCLLVLSRCDNLQKDPSVRAGSSQRQDPEERYHYQY